MINTAVLIAKSQGIEVKATFYDETFSITVAAQSGGIAGGGITYKHPIINELYEDYKEWPLERFLQLKIQEPAGI